MQTCPADARHSGDGQSSEASPDVADILERERDERGEFAGGEVSIPIRAVLCAQIEAEALVVIAKAGIESVHVFVDQIVTGAERTGPELHGTAADRGGELLTALEV